MMISHMTNHEEQLLLLQTVLHRQTKRCGFEEVVSLCYVGYPKATEELVADPVEDLDRRSPVALANHFFKVPQGPVLVHQREGIFARKVCEKSAKK
jgi:hypothetical protein